MVLLLLLLAACGQPDPCLECPMVYPNQRSLQGEALGTTWTVKWLEDTRILDATVEDAVVTALSEVDAAMSTWRTDSELSRARAADGPIPVSAETAMVVEAALTLARDTGGAFDPTVEPLMELWGFRGTPRTTLPTDAEIEAARAQVGWDRVSVEVRDGQAYLDTGGTALDVSAIAKGHAVDRVSLALSELQLPNHMVEIGGEVRVQGHGQSAHYWAIGVDLPEPGRGPGTELVESMIVTNLAVATSGNYRNFFEIEGTTVHHTMDPRTGRPAPVRVASATVVAPDCRTADGIATALMVLPPDEGIAFVEARPDVNAMLLLPGGDALEKRLSSGMARHVVTETE